MRLKAKENIQTEAKLPSLKLRPSYKLKVEVKTKFEAELASSNPRWRPSLRLSYEAQSQGEDQNWSQVTKLKAEVKLLLKVEEKNKIKEGDKGVNPP